ncbi:hypothetical protein [Paenibacillus turicensis]|uniref:hypothetical protein n=1 Tax=Paenibacillus turicensis TaxID=160487 RepID=UPI001FD84893|nr:hypothetical protein [Paenibacillus turicensis]
MPSGDVIQKDSEELDEALLNGTIDETLYNLARKEADLINSLVALSQEHKDILLQKLQK